jgi:hypothetical protein
MRTIAILVALVAITSIAAAQNTATPDEPRMLQLIQLKYIDVGTVIRIFGGSIIPTTGYSGAGYTAWPRGRRGGYSHARTGSQVGGSLTAPRTYGYQPQNNYGNYGHGTQSGNDQLPAPTPNTGQQYNAY